MEVVGTRSACYETATVRHQALRRQGRPIPHPTKTEQLCGFQSERLVQSTLLHRCPCYEHHLPMAIQISKHLVEGNHVTCKSEGPESPQGKVEPREPGPAWYLRAAPVNQVQCHLKGSRKQTAFLQVSQGAVIRSKRSTEPFRLVRHGGLESVSEYHFHFLTMHHPPAPQTITTYTSIPNSPKYP